MLTLRPATDADLAAITAIYGHHVSHGTGTFETTPPTLADMTARRADVLARGLPYWKGVGAQASPTVERLLKEAPAAAPAPAAA